MNTHKVHKVLSISEPNVPQKSIEYPYQPVISLSADNADSVIFTMHLES